MAVAARRAITWEARRGRPRSRAEAVRRPRLGILGGAGARLFTLSAGVLAFAFLVALLYLYLATVIAADGYDLELLRARRVELQRENALLEIEARRLASPARLEAEAKRIGLTKAHPSLFITSGPIVAGSR